MNWQQLAAHRKELGRPYIMAHRGASAVLPENSPSAFYQAIADGAEVIETDLHLTKDRHLVLIHDPTLDRTTHGRGAIRELTLAEIKQHKIRQPAHRQGIDERVLTLPEYVAYTGGRIPTALELKDPRFIGRRYAEQLVTTLEDLGVREFFGVIAFELPKLRAVQAVNSEMATGWITLNDPRPRQPVSFLGPLWPLLLLNPFYVSWAHRLGKLVCPLDPHPDKRLNLYLRLGVDMLLTNDPAATRRAMQSRLTSL